MSPVEQIKERLSILEVIGVYVELTKAGKQYKGKSPFTNEKTPSFFVSPDRGMYYCFSSQKGGDMFTFIEEMEGVDFKGALKILADKAGVELVPEDPKVRTEREAQYALLEEATSFFFKEREKYPEATEYIEKRGVAGKTLHLWRIGYAPPEWRALRTALKEKGFTDAQMLNVGLIKKADGGKEPYDMFRDRIMFPIFDSSGRPVAFSGRILHQDDKAPKYVNSPETEFFQKSKILYGYDKAKQGIRQYDFSLIVEGQFDVVLAHQAGYTNTVAVSGTALTAGHVTLFEHLSSRVVLALDADRAGVSAVKRSAELMLRRGIDVKVAALPEGEDPADIIGEDPKRFRQIIGGSVHVIEFLLTVLRSAAKDERAYKLRAREEIVPLLVIMPNRIDRDHFETVVAEAVGTKPDAIHYEVERLQSDATLEARNIDSAPAPRDVQAKIDRRFELAKNLYVLTLVFGSEQAVLADQTHAYLKKWLKEGEYKALEKLPKDEVSRMAFVAESHLEKMPRGELAADLSEKLTELSHLTARSWLQELRKQIAEAEKVGDAEALEKHLKETKRAEVLLQETIELQSQTGPEQGDKH
jgi:DNA primase